MIMRRRRRIVTVMKAMMRINDDDDNDCDNVDGDGDDGFLTFFFLFITHTWMILLTTGRRPGRRVQPQVQLLLRRPSRGAPWLLRRPHLVRYSALADFARKALRAWLTSFLRLPSCGVWFGTDQPACRRRTERHTTVRFSRQGKRTCSLLTQQFLLDWRSVFGNRTKRKFVFVCCFFRRLFCYFNWSFVLLSSPVGSEKKEVYLCRILINQALSVH